MFGRSRVIDHPSAPDEQRVRESIEIRDRGVSDRLL
jgi:hypothetical protein